MVADFSRVGARGSMRKRRITSLGDGASARTQTDSARAYTLR
jgi:hypothetical protein